MAIIWNTRSELLREPNLLVPGKKPVGGVKIDPSSPISSDHALYLFRASDGGRIASGRSLAGTYSGGTIVQEPETAFITDQSAFPINAFWNGARSSTSILLKVHVVLTSGSTKVMSIGASSGGILYFLRTDAKDFDIELLSGGPTTTSDGSGGGTSWVNQGDIISIVFTRNSPAYYYYALNHTTGVSWEASGSDAFTWGSTILEGFIGIPGSELRWHHLLVDWTFWPPTYAKSLLRDPYQYLIPK